jgi:hypothetical protein
MFGHSNPSCDTVPLKKSQYMDLPGFKVQLGLSMIFGDSKNFLFVINYHWRSELFFDRHLSFIYRERRNEFAGVKIFCPPLAIAFFHKYLLPIKKHGGGSHMMRVVANFAKNLHASLFNEGLLIDTTFS